MTLRIRIKNGLQANAINSENTVIATRDVAVADNEIPIPDTEYTVKDQDNNVLDTGLLVSGKPGQEISVVAGTGGTPFAVDFTADDVTPDTNQVVTFTSSVGASPTLYVWDFGDGTSSNLANPTKKYLAPGTYTVRLFATNGTSSGVKVRTSYLTVTLETPPQTNLQAWYKAGVGASPANMTLSSGKVANWVDAKNGYDIAQATGSKQPAYTSNLLNGYGGLTFTAHQLSIANALFTRTSGSTVIVVFKLNALGGTDVLHEASVSNLYEVYFAQSEPTLYNGNFRPAYWGIHQEEIILTTVFDGANSYVRYNNLPKEMVGNTGTSSSSGFTLGGATGTIGADINATIYEVLVYSSEPSSGDYNLITQYIATKFGIKI